MTRTYWVRGDDGDEYGPVDREEIRHWIAEDRMGLDTEIREGGGDARWQALQHYPELVVLIAENEVKRQRPDVVEGLPLASFGARAAAVIVDLLIINLVSSLLFIFLLLGLGISMEQFSQEVMDFFWEKTKTPPPAYGLGQLLSITCLLLYFGFFVARDGQTPGMGLFRLRVVDQGGMTVSTWTAVIRAMGLYFSVSFLGIGFFLALFTAKRQTFHDLLARTYVIQLPRPERTSHAPYGSQSDR